MPGMPGEPGAQGLAGSPGSQGPPGVVGSDGKDGTCPDSCLSSQLRCQQQTQHQVKEKASAIHHQKKPDRL